MYVLGPVSDLSLTDATLGRNLRVTHWNPLIEKTQTKK